MATAIKTVEDVKSWLTDKGFQEYAPTFHANKIDGEALTYLTERALETLIPVMGDRMKFLNLLQSFQKAGKEDASGGADEGPSSPGGTGDAEHVEAEVASGETQKQSRTKKHSLACKRRQRINRNKRKREEKKLLKKGLTALIQDLKKENECLSNKFKIETNIKEKYFEMWRESEKEKDKLKTSKLVFCGFNQRPVANFNDNSSTKLSKSTEILAISPSLLEDFESETELGRGRFGVVCLKKFRSTPVAVKYFDSSTLAKVVEKEALFLRECCHINLPVIYGMNNTQKPFFIVTQFYGNESFQPATLRSIISQDTKTVMLGTENWLHIVVQINDGLCYLHNKAVIHNDIKNDNIIIVRNPNGFYSPILIDFGKACLLREARTKYLSNEEKQQFYKLHFHIAPEVIEGTSPQSVKSDMYSFGVVIASIYNYVKYRPLKELARHCLKPGKTRCTSLELCVILKKLIE